MSSDELFLVRLLKALDASALEAIVVGTTAAVLQGAPVMTQDVDLLIRDTVKNREKIPLLCQFLGEARAVEVSPLSKTITLLGPEVPVDLLFDTIPGDLTFESIRARSTRVQIGDQVAIVAALEDVIVSKRAAGRPKDLAQLPVLEDTLKTKLAMSKA
jgi:hypothetical protein